MPNGIQTLGTDIVADLQMELNFLPMPKINSFHLLPSQDSLPVSQLN